ncbi:MAG: alpha/beta hydrolase [Bacteroidetes bacterium]|nr:alpha/beta hydrolase [Bacteroidota bacterium]
MRSDFFLFRDSLIHYTCYGTGSRILLGFHGYGESAQSFALLEEALNCSGYTLIAIDMPFHGQTKWKEALFFKPRDLLVLVEELVRRHGSRDEPWTLLGYSMGGRVALQLLELAPEKIKKLVLLAPDGLRMNPWYWLATQTKRGNRLFRGTMENPSWFFSLLRVGNALKLVNPGIYKFTLRYIDDQKARHDLYTRWTTMRGFRPNLAEVKEIVRSRDIPVRLVFGRYDRIILSTRGERFRKGIENQCALQILPTGHQLLQAGNIDLVLEQITS